MKLRRFNDTGRDVSEVGMGCWQIGGNWGEVNEDAALQTLRAAVEAGVTFLDTADCYGAGRSERLIGRFLADVPEASRPFVATKCGRGGPCDYSLGDLRKYTEVSLERLGAGSLDLTQLHCPPTAVLREGKVFAALRTLRDEGLIRNFGVSVESMEEALLCLEHEGLASLQIIFNIFRQKPIEVLFDRAAAAGVALIVRLPLASGLLAGKMTKDTKFSADDHRTFNEDGAAFNVGETFAGLGLAKGVELADAVKPLVPAGMTMAQVSLRWCLDHPAVTVIIPGAKDPRQAVANAAASDLPPLGDGLHRKLAELYRDRVAAHIRGPY